MDTEKHGCFRQAARDCVLPEVPDGQSAPRDRSASGQSSSPLDSASTRGLAADPAAMHDTAPCDIRGTAVIPDVRPRKDGPGGE